MPRIIKGLIGGGSSSERILRRFNPVGVNTAGTSAVFNRATSTFDVSMSPERRAAINDIRSGYDAQARAFGGLREQVAPGMSRLSGQVVDSLRSGLRERLQAIRGEGRRTVGNIREQLARRRLAGSSFQTSEMAAAEAEFSQQADQARAQADTEIAKVQADAFLAEMDMTQSLIKDQFTSSLAGIQTVLQQLNLDTGVATQLAGLTSQLMEDNLVAQAEARAAQEQAGEDFLGTLIASADNMFGSFMGAVGGGGGASFLGG